jgi:hypothetical protein
MVLINVDAALFASSRSMGKVVVIRDHSGTCVAACSDVYQEVTIPELAEAMAVRKTLVFAKEEGLERVSLPLTASQLCSVSTQEGWIAPSVDQLSKHQAFNRFFLCLLYFLC